MTITCPNNGDHLFYDEFEEATRLKLEILEMYLTAWIPVFLSLSYIDNINIFDFFSGEGVDAKGSKGSPLIILDIIKKFQPSLEKCSPQKKINVHLNDKDLARYKKLASSVDSYELPSVISKPKVTNQSFEDCFTEYHPVMSERSSANFLWLDPFGMNITTTTIQKITQLQKTDFLVFIPVNHIYRFINQQCVQSKYENINPDDFKNIKTAHRALKEYFREQCGKDYYLQTFALMKTTASKNIYCLLFGSAHPLGLDKFIRECWKLDPKNGEANFSFFGDESASLFDKNYTGGSTKARDFQERLHKKIRNKELLTNKDIYDFALASGFFSTSSFIKDVLKELKAQKILKTSKLALSYQEIFTKKKIVEIDFV